MPNPHAQDADVDTLVRKGQERHAKLRLQLKQHVQRQEENSHACPSRVSECPALTCLTPASTSGPLQGPSPKAHTCPCALHPALTPLPRLFGSDARASPRSPSGQVPGTGEGSCVCQAQEHVWGQTEQTASLHPPTTAAGAEDPAVKGRDKGPALLELAV